MMRCRNVNCPQCGGILSINSCYPRHILDEDGNRHDGWIVQGKCDICKKYPSLIPDFIMPYKYFNAAVIEAAISKFEEEGGLHLNECPADESTIRRWVSQFEERGARAVGWLLSMLFNLYGQHISALELQDKGLLKQLAHLTRNLSVPKIGGVIGRVNVILTKHNSGFL